MELETSGSELFCIGQLECDLADLHRGCRVEHEAAPLLPPLTVLRQEVKLSTN